MTLYSLFPTADDLLATRPEDLAPVLLRLGAAARQGGMFVTEAVTNQTIGTGMAAERGSGYTFHKRAEVERHLSEAWECLRADRLLIPAPDINGRNGFLMLSQAGEAAIASPGGFESIRAARDFPKDLLHPSIRDKVSAELLRGDYDDAVRTAMTEVEIATRRVGGFTANDIGVALMRKAFHPKDGPLTDMGLPEGEREMEMQFAAGAVGAYKNPHSHRTPGLSFEAARDRLLIASSLLRLIEARASAAVAATP